MATEECLAPFIDVYKNIPDEWLLDRRKVNRILRRYTNQFNDELKVLENNGFSITPYFRDRRSDSQYIYDIISGWAIEDIICDVWLHKHVTAHDPNIRVEHSGDDKQRNLEKYVASRMTTVPDFILTSYDKRIEIELQMSRSVRKAYDMKANKVNRVIDSGGKFLWIILPTSQYFVCDPKIHLNDVTPVKNFLWGGKEVYRLNLEKIEEIGLYNISDGIPEDIIDIIST